MKKPRRSLDDLLQRSFRLAEETKSRENIHVKAAKVRAHYLAAHERMRALGIERKRVAEALRLKRRPGDPRPRKPGEGGEPIPAFPRPKPKPLSGGAAARLKFTERKPHAASPLRVIPVPVTGDDEAGIRL